MIPGPVGEWKAPQALQDTLARNRSRALCHPTRGPGKPPPARRQAGWGPGCALTKGLVWPLMK